MKVLLKKFTLSLFLLCFVANFAVALEPQKAADFAEGIIKIASQTASDNSISKAKKIAKLTDLFSSTYDIKTAAKFSLGTEWRNISEEQRESFTQAYKTYLVAAQTNNVVSFLSGFLSFKQADVSQMSSSSVSIKFNITYKAQDTKIKNISLELVVKDGNDGMKVFDVIFEGISLLQSQRSEFANIIANKGFDGLLKDLKSKNKANDAK